MWTNCKRWLARATGIGYRPLETKPPPGNRELIQSAVELVDTAKYFRSELRRLEERLDKVAR